MKIKLIKIILILRFMKAAAILYEDLVRFDYRTVRKLSYFLATSVGT